MAKKITINDLAVMMKKEFDSIDKRFDTVDKRFDKMGKSMVTKDYLDEKLSDLRGDLVVLTRKEDTKLKKLISILNKKKIISNKDVDELFKMEPFPELKLHLKN